MVSELRKIIDQVSRDKGIDRTLLIQALEEAVLSAAKKKFGIRRDLEVRFNEELGEIELFQFRTVVEVVEDEQTQISLEDARDLDPDVDLYDDLGSKMDNVSELGRIAAQSAKQVIIQKMKDAESDVIYDLYKDRKGEVVNGIVQRFERGKMVVNLGRTDAILPASEQMPRRSYRQGDRVRAILLDVRQGSRDAQLILSRTSNLFVEKLFAIEVPEIAEGIVKVMGVVREPGVRAKIAVSSSDSDVDPVGACVGMKGSRVQNVVQELQGERIDIVPWSPDPAKFVSNALAPAQVSMVVVDEERNKLLVVVPDDQLSLAIGRGGQNVRLAAALLGWKIDVKSEDKYAKAVEDGYQSLMAVEGVSESLADALRDADVTSVQELAEADQNDIAKMEQYGIGLEQSAVLIAAAKKIMATPKPVEVAEVAAEAAEVEETESTESTESTPATGEAKVEEPGEETTGS